jgi:hypothetical protein
MALHEIKGNFSKSSCNGFSPQPLKFISNFIILTCSHLIQIHPEKNLISKKSSRLFIHPLNAYLFSTIEEIKLHKKIRFRIKSHYDIIVLRSGLLMKKCSASSRQLQAVIIHQRYKTGVIVYGSKWKGLIRNCEGEGLSEILPSLPCCVREKIITSKHAEKRALHSSYGGREDERREKKVKLTKS